MLRALNRTRRTWRNLRRIRQISAVLVRYGLHDLLQGLGLQRTVRALRRRDLAPTSANRPESLRLALEELGPSFVKLGQMLSTRPDLVPPEYLGELAQLQHAVKPLPFPDVRAVLESELDDSALARLTHIDERPLAAGSMAQVHRAKLDGAQDVVIKIQRPGVEGLFQTDVELLRDLAALLERDEEIRLLYQPSQIVDELARGVRRELDFSWEGRVTERCRRNAPKDGVSIPRVHLECTTRRVLTLDYLQGVRPTDPDVLKAAGLQPEVVAERFVEAFFRQVFDDGVFHADPHPGNILVLPGNAVAMLDFGLVGSLDDVVREQLLDLVYALLRRDAGRMVRVAITGGQAPPRVDVRALRHEVWEFLDEYAGGPLGQMRMSSLMTDFFDLLHRHRIRFPPDLVLLAKALSTAEGVARNLDPEMDVIQRLKPHLLRAWRRRLSPKQMVRRARDLSESSARLVRELPTAAGDLLRQLRAGEFQLAHEHRGLDRLVLELDRSTNRIALGILVAALIVGSSIVTHSGTGPRLGDVPVLGLGGYLVSGVLGLWLTIGILRSGRL